MGSAERGREEGRVYAFAVRRKTFVAPARGRPGVRVRGKVRRCSRVEAASHAGLRYVDPCPEQDM